MGLFCSSQGKEAQGKEGALEVACVAHLVRRDSAKAGLRVLR
jgi:hypothetical protein